MARANQHWSATQSEAMVGGGGEEERTRMGNFKEGFVSLP